MDSPKFVRCRPYGLAHENVRLRLARKVRLPPQAAPHQTASERPLLVKADAQICHFLKIHSERLALESSPSGVIVWATATDPKATLTGLRETQASCHN